MLFTMSIPISKLNDRAILPAYQSSQAAGADLHACLESDVVIGPGQVELISTGISIGLPKGFEAQIRSRSGLAAKHSLAVLNSPGTIDSDYRGEIKIILINHGSQDFTVTHGDRVAQLVIARHETVDFSLTDNLETTERGSGGFGSTLV